MKITEKIIYLKRVADLCYSIAEDILKNGRSLEVQRYAQGYVEIESPMVGGTDADWIRINFGDVYVFLHDDGTVGFDLDPYAAYGAELISVNDLSVDEFKLLVAEYVTKNGYEWELGDEIPEYVPFCECHGKDGE